MATAKKTAAEGFDAFAMYDNEAFKAGYENFVKGVNAVTDFQKDAYEAAMASANVVAKGYEKAANAQVSYAKEAFEDGVAAAKAVTAVKSVQEFVDLQNDYFQTATEKANDQFAAMADHWTAIAKDATDPLSKRYAEFLEAAQSYRP